MFELHVESLILGALAMGVAAGILAVACIDEPAPSGRSRRVSLVAGVIAFGLLVAGVVALIHVDLTHFGFFVAGAELALASAVWVARSSGRRDDGDGGGGGGGGDKGPDGPGPQVPEHYWERWEQSLREHIGV